MNGLWNLALDAGRTERVLPGATVPEVFANAVRERGDAVWMREKKLGLWRAWTWNEAATAVREIALGLAALGLQPMHQFAHRVNELATAPELLEIVDLATTGGDEKGEHRFHAGLRLE